MVDALPVDSKTQLRAHARQLGLQDDAEASLARTRRLLSLPEFREPSCVALFVSISDEPSTADIRDRLGHRGIPVLLPILRPDLHLDWARDREPLEAGRHGLLQPTGPHVELRNADVLLVPCVAVDLAGNRLGRGGGSYDRTIAAYRADRPDGSVVGFAFDGTVVDHLPVEPHDQGVDVVVTESRTIRLSLDR